MVFDLLLLVKADGQVVWACLSDVKAAFPSVPGFAWNRAYARVRLPAWIRGCFNFNESGCRARVSTAHGYTDRYEVPPVGATQGAADSPSKFLCHIDVLLRFLANEGREHGVRVCLPDGWHRVKFDGEEGDILVDGGVVVASAFADDLLLLAGSYASLQALLELVQVFYGYIGGQVVPHKSYWFTTASDADLASMPLKLEVLSDFGLIRPAGPLPSDGRPGLCRRLSMELAVQTWCEYHELPSLTRRSAESGERERADGTVVTRVTLELPSSGYSLRSESYAQLVRTLVSNPPMLDGIVLKFRLATPPPHLPCYRESAPAHLLGYPLGRPLPLTPLGLMNSTRYLGFLLDAGISFGDQMDRIEERISDDCAAARRAAFSVGEASTLLNGFSGGAVGFLAGGVPLSVRHCRPLEASVATALGACGRNSRKVGGAQLREPAPVGVNAFCLSARVAETSITTALRVLNSAGRPESGTALAALLSEGRRLGFLHNPLSRPGCFSAASQSYWGAVASWLTVYGWVVKLPIWVAEWTSSFESDVPLERVWEAVHAGTIRRHPGDGAERYSDTELRKAMEYAGERRWLFLSQCVATSIRPWSVGSKAAALFPAPEVQWLVRTDRLTGAGGRILRSMLTDDGLTRVRCPVLSLCVRSEWREGLQVELGSYPALRWPWEVGPWQACPASHADALARCSGAFSDGTQRDNGSGLFSGFGLAWAHDGVTSCASGVVTCGSSAFRGEGAGAGAAIEDHAKRRPGTVLHLHSDCMGVLGRVWAMYIGVWDDKLVAADGSAPLWRAVHRIVQRFCAVGCSLELHWVPGHTAGRTDVHLSQDLCDALCDTLRREGWDSLLQGPTTFAYDFNAVLFDNVGTRCSDAVSAWLKGARWKVLEVMREKKIESAPAWEVTWRTISDMVTGRDSVLLSPVALGSRSNGKPVKSVIGDTDVSTLAPPAPFDMRWLKVLNGRTPSSTALDATAAPRPCPGAVRDACGLCGGLDVPAHLLGDDDPLCPLAANAPVFRQMLASLWFRHGVPLLRNREVSVIPREVRVAVGYRSGFVAAVKPARDAVPWKLLQVLLAPAGPKIVFYYA